MSGLTSDGFEIKRLPEIQADLEEAFRAKFPGISVTPDSVVGQIIGLMANPLSDLWEILEAVYLSQYPASAEGFSLDNVAQMTGIVRLAATQSQVEAIIEGTEGTIVPDDNQASVAVTGDIFEQVGPVTITKLSVLRTKIGVGNVLNNQLYTVTLDSIGYDFTSDADATAIEIAAGLTSSINVGQAYLTAVDNNDGTLTITVDDKDTPFSVDVDVNLTLDEIWSPALYESKETGAIVANTGTLTTIETPVSGFDAIDNLNDADLGRDLETDPELRLRRIQSLAIAAAGTVEAIKARLLQQVDSVLSVKIFENRTDVTDGGGRPPHSFEAVVQGGTNQDIGDKIWEVKPAGIATHGNVSVNVTDTEGDTQVMKFSRPTSRYAWVDVTITLNPEEDFPVDGLTLIRQKIYDFGIANYDVGDDFILQKLYTPVFEVQGIATATIQISTTPGPTAVTGTNSNVSANKLVDTSAEQFLDGGVEAGMTCKNVTDATETTVNGIDSAVQLDLAADIFLATGKSYSVEKTWSSSNIVIGEVSILLWDMDRITAQTA